MQKNENRPGYRQTKVGWVPDDWECRPFTDIFDRIINPLMPKTFENYQQIGVRSHGRGVFHKKAVSGEEIGSKRVFYCEPGALVFNIVFAWEQAVAILTDNEKGFIASHRFPMYTGKKGQAFEPFFLSFFKTRRGKQGLSIASPGGAGRNKTLGQKEMNYLFVPVPKEAEQKAIAQVLECWDKTIRAYERKLEKKQSIYNRLLNSLFSEADRDLEFVSKWERDSIKNLTALIKDGSHGTHEEIAAGIPLLSAKDIKKGKVNIPCNCRRISSEDFQKIHRNYAIETDDVLLSIVGTIGKVALVGTYQDSYTFQRSVAILRVNEKLKPKFFASYLLTTSFQKALKRRENKGAQGGVYLGELSKILVPVPSIEEQEVVAKIVEDAEKELSFLEEKLTIIKSQKKYLLNNLVTGTLRLPQFISPDSTEKSRNEPTA